MKFRYCRHGLSLVEVLAAGVILSGTVVTIGALSSKSLLSTGQHQAYEKAASLIDRQLTLIDVIGMDAFLDKGVTEGEFGDVAPGYAWQVTSTYLEVDNLYKVTMTVFWSEYGRPRSLSVSTRLNGISSLTVPVVSNES